MEISWTTRNDGNTVSEAKIIMPKKKPFTSANVKSLENTLREGYSSLLAAKSVLAGYLKRDSDLRKQLDQLCKDYHKFEQDCSKLSANRNKI